MLNFSSGQHNLTPVHSHFSSIYPNSTHGGNFIFSLSCFLALYIKTDIKFDLPEGLKIGDWTASQPTQFGTTGTTIYEDKAEYVFPIIGDSTWPIKCVVSYQVCDNHICMPPAQKELQVVALR